MENLPNTETSQDNEQTQNLPKRLVPRRKIIAVILVILIVLAVGGLLAAKQGIFKKAQTPKVPSEAQLIEQTRTAGLLSESFQAQIIEKKPIELKFIGTPPSTPADYPTSGRPVGAANRDEYLGYFGQYDHLVAEYYATASKEVFDLAGQWRDLIKSKFPDDFAQDEAKGLYIIREINK